MNGVTDIIRPGLRVLFCGINPGVRSGELGQHFARPGNRFWKLLHLSGFTDRVLAPAEQDQLLAYGVGITNLVEATTATAAELTTAQLRAGGRHLEEKVREMAPSVVAILGMQAYRTAFQRPRAVLGRQPEQLGPSTLWLLPNPSGLQARYQMPEMTDQWAEVHKFVPPLAEDHRRA